jgi:hypothetical protein
MSMHLDSFINSFSFDFLFHFNHSLTSSRIQQKTEHDLTGVTQTMPIDISGTASLPQSQVHHAGEFLDGIIFDFN